MSLKLTGAGGGAGGGVPDTPTNYTVVPLHTKDIVGSTFEAIHSWDYTTDPDSFTIYANTVDNFATASEFAAGIAGDVRTRDYGRTSGIGGDGAECYFWIVAVVGGVESLPAGSVHILAALVIDTFEAGSSTTIDVLCPDPGSATFVWQKSTNGADWDTTNCPTSFSGSISGLDPNTAYFGEVGYTQAGLNSWFSVPASATTYEVLDPGEIHLDNKTDTTAEFSFTISPSGGSGLYAYQWYRNNTLLVDETADTLNDTGLDPNTEYEWYCDVTSGGQTSPTNTITDTTYPTLDPGVIQLDSITDTTAELSFATPPSGGTGSYSYAWTRDGSPVGGDTATLSETGLTPDTEYDWKCTVTSATQSDDTNTITDTTYSAGAWAVDDSLWEVNTSYWYVG